MWQNRLMSLKFGGRSKFQYAVVGRGERSFNKRVDKKEKIF